MNFLEKIKKISLMHNDEQKLIIRKLVRKVFPKKTVKKIYKLRKEASLRDFYRVFVSDRHSCIAMVLNEPDPEALAEKIILSTDVCESLKINVPGIYRYFTPEGVFLVKDAGSLSLEALKKKMGRRSYLREYKKAVDIILRLKYAHRDKPVFINPPFDTELFSREFAFFIEHSDIQRIISIDQLKEVKELFNKVSESLPNTPYSLQHRDFHSRNIHVKDSELVIFDHQDIRMGPVSYDLVSLLKDSYVSLDNDDEIALLRYYFSQAKEKWHDIIDENDFFKAYYLTAFQRSVKAAGTFFYQVKVRNNKKYKKYIPTVISYAIEALMKIEWLTGDNSDTLMVLEKLKKSMVKSD